MLPVSPAIMPAARSHHVMLSGTVAGSLQLYTGIQLFSGYTRRYQAIFPQTVWRLPALSHLSKELAL